LVRSYALSLIPDTLPAVKNNGDGYETDTERDMVLDNEVDDDNDEETPKKKRKGDKPKVRDLIEEDDNEDDEETPKKKKKGDKPKVRDQIEAQRDAPATPEAQEAQEDMEVSDTLLESKKLTSCSCLIRFVKFKLSPRASPCCLDVSP
jgi:hypothetical protein